MAETKREKFPSDLLSSYKKALTILKQYDDENLRRQKKRKAKFVLKTKDCRQIVKELKKRLADKKDKSGAGSLFGQEYAGKFEGIIKGLYQTYAGKEVYASLEEKAAHLLYFAVKDHPFADGNKRIAAFLFVYFLDRNNFSRAAVRRNIATFRKIIGSKTKLMAVVKSNAYGHGLLEFSKLADKFGADWFGSDALSEALKLRKNGIKKPILVLGYTRDSRLSEAAKNNVSLTIYNFESLRYLMKHAREFSKHPLKIHLKIDTGMHRQGIYL